MPSTINTASLPRLAEQKNKVARSATAKKFKVIYAAEDIKRLPLNHPHRLAFQAGGDPAVRALLAREAAAA